MRRTRKLLMVSLACAGMVMVLLLTAVLTTHLLANRDMVKSFIVTKTAQATGGVLVYDRLDISFLPMPHLKARDIHLRRRDAFDVTARELSVYPGILPLLKGRVSIRRLALITPEAKVFMDSDPMKKPDMPVEKTSRSLEDGIRTAIGGLFGALAAIDPGTELKIEGGTVTLMFTDAPDIRIDAINASAVNDDGDLSLNLRCRSDITGRLALSAAADIQTRQASGKITLTDINLRPLLFHASLPGGITTEDTHATVNATFTLNGPEAVNGRFDIHFPFLTVMRKGLSLKLDTVAVSGAVDCAGKDLSITIDSLKSAQPALELSTAASFTHTSDTDRSVVEIRATAEGLDVAVAGAATRAIAGDLDEIRTAFSVAKEGRLTDASYSAGFDVDETGWHMKKMKAAGHLSRGLVTLPGIEADLERMDGNVIYEDRHVAFKNVSGHFKGATFKELDAAIDWEKEATLSISSPSVAVDIAPLHDWLTAFKDLSGIKNYIESVTGGARLSKVHINGPLTEPGNWAFEISGTPENMRLTSPVVPFAVSLSGGEITYMPGKERATNVKIAFLDGSFVSSYQSNGIIDPESVACRIDGSMGPEALAWVIAKLHIPGHLQMKPPVNLSNISIDWSKTKTLSFMGGMKTAGGVDLFADFTVSPQDWQIRRIQFADGSSRATAAARKRADGIEVSFSGNVGKTTADRLLEHNPILSGRIEGDFSAVLDTRSPLKSSFTGKLAGEGLHFLGLVPDPIDVRQFSIDGYGGKLKIEPSEIYVCNSLLKVDGMLDSSDGSLTVDLNVDADRLDEELIRTLHPIDREKADTPRQTAAASAMTPRGAVHLKANDFTYGGFTWSQVRADVRLDGENTQVQINQADLCGISTTGKLGFSPRGMSLHITPTATGASLQETANCLWQKPVKAQARYDLTGEINLPPTPENPTRSMSGHMEFSSDNGKIEYSNVLMKIFSVLNITEMFTGGQSDLTEAGYGYAKAYAKADIGEGKLQFSEILLDGNSLKITGQGTIALDTRETDFSLLAAPLKTIDRIVNKIPIVNYIAGGSLISIPLHVTGPLADIKVTPMSPLAVGEGLLNLMGRTLKAPFKLVQSASEFAVEESSKLIAPSTAESPPGTP
ncbi:AsmA-like C-terminal domain-containing protein [uncultured Desulfosarcina sp.]|uniref:YhdP family protein n=1 Tax=uncultured Desulfosarcina sp. TaxID=218289 RepID=UPI0029C71E54|nr:AsmA-like C-terminal domain-containing protein [uncultured Desulfosarcina sp.]